MIFFINCPAKTCPTMRSKMLAFAAPAALSATAVTYSSYSLEANWSGISKSKSEIPESLISRGFSLSREIKMSLFALNSI
jgi:hypothetical protein